MSETAERSILGFTPRLFVYVTSMIVLAAAALALAGAHVAAAPPANDGAWLGIGLFLALALGSDLRPVPLDEDGNNVSLAFVFIIASRLIFGWDVAILIAAVSIAPSEIIRRKPVLRVSFNSAAYAIAAISAGITSAFGSFGSNDVMRLTLYAFLSGMIFIFVNTAVVAGAVALSDGAPYSSTFSTLIRYCGGAFTIMAFLAALAANLWNIRPELLVLLAGPLFALTLYQRTALRSRIAVRDANTDNLTGLGNHRAYQAALRERIEDAERTGAEFSLGIVDVDDFKRINDTYGHQVGDDVLVALAELLRDAPGPDAYRCGGDEFALLFAGDATTAFEHVTEIQETVANLGMTPITISVGIASFPSQANEADGLQRMADGALYWSKHHGKNRSFVYSPKVVRIHSAKELEWETERMARLRAAKNIVRFVDAKDPSTANHSETVSALAAAIGVQLGLDENTIDQLALGGLLHDIGKIGIPDALLQAPRGLTREEFEQVKAHPALGYSLLEGLGIAPIDEWILHHHENWQGDGYPDGLAGEEIPLGARVIRVADAFEAMTANRPYRPAQTLEYALAELHANTGTQFERSVVLALEGCLATVPSSDAHRAALAFALA